MNEGEDINISSKSTKKSLVVPNRTNYKENELHSNKIIRIG